MVRVRITRVTPLRRNVGGVQVRRDGAVGDGVGGSGSGSRTWYNASLTLSAAGTDSTSGIDSCQLAVVYSGPDDGSASVSRTCADNAGNVGTGSKGFKYDATAPSVTVSADRAPDHGGWYNHPVAYSITAKSDATSGIDLASCDAGKTFSGPDSATAQTDALGCSDNAGNSATDRASLQYDATAPSVTVSADRAPDHGGWYNHPVGYSITAKSDATSGIDLASCDAGKTFSGPDSATAQTDALGCSDNAGNSATDRASLQYDATNPLVTVAVDAGSGSRWLVQPSGRLLDYGEVGCDVGDRSGEL